MDMDCPKRGGAVAAAGIPDDPLVEILSRVPVKSLCRFKCVSKAWRDLIADPLHRRKLPQTLEGFFYGHYERMDGEIRGGGGDRGSGGSGNGGDGDGNDEGAGDGDGSDGDGGEDDESLLRNAYWHFGHGDTLYRYMFGHFIDLSGRPVPLVDPSFSFLARRPGIENIRLLHSCNGLLLFGHGREHILGYVVCNPATEEWVDVPSSGWNLPPPEANHHEDDDGENDDKEELEHTYLIFDPAVSSHFKLVQFLQKGSMQREVGLRTFSSETGVWSDRANGRRQEGNGECQQFGSFGAIASNLGCAIVNGMLHLIVYHIQKDRELIVAVDGEGKTHRVICWPERRGCGWSEAAFVGQSQGHLHCISEHLEGNSAQITIWVLEDYNTEEWVMKHSLSSLQLFGKVKYLVQFDYIVVSIHPDRNLIFIVQRWDRKLISYDMDSKEVHTLCTLVNGYECITPYVPYFLESSVLANQN
ncbi:hypothetical protein ACP70R_015006 [Stipagrostis hirtigluma subsp. patula]